MLISKIISGGQTGVDSGAIKAALEFGFPYGGLIPKGRRVEDGIVPLEFAAMTEDTRKDYLHCMELNVINSDATIILSRERELTGGTKHTVEFCEKHGKPYWIDNPEQPIETDRGLELFYWIEAEFGEREIVLNVAGQRESKSPGIEASTTVFVKRLIEASDDYLEQPEPLEMCEGNPPRQSASQKIEFDAHGIREVKRPFEAHCGNCFTRMTTGTWRCPTHGVDVDIMHICDRYKPGLM